MKRGNIFKTSMLFILTLFINVATISANGNQTEKEVALQEGNAVNNEKSSEDNAFEFSIQITTSSVHLVFEDKRLSDEIKKAISDDLNMLLSHLEGRHWPAWCRGRGSWHRRQAGRAYLVTA